MIEEMKQLLDGGCQVEFDRVRHLERGSDEIKGAYECTVSSDLGTRYAIHPTDFEQAFYLAYERAMKGGLIDER